MTVGEWQQNHTLVAALQAMTAAAVPAAMVTHLLRPPLLPPQGAVRVVLINRVLAADWQQQLAQAIAAGRLCGAALSAVIHAVSCRVWAVLQQQAAGLSGVAWLCVQHLVAAAAAQGRTSLMLSEFGIAGWSWVRHRIRWPDREWAQGLGCSACAPRRITSNAAQPRPRSCAALVCGSNPSSCACLTYCCMWLTDTTTTTLTVIAPIGLMKRPTMRGLTATRSSLLAPWSWMTRDTPLS